VQTKLGEHDIRLAGQLHKNLEIVGELLGDLAIGSTTINTTC
jgi:hypothetical protein